MDESSMYEDSYLLDDSVAINNLSPRRCSPSRAEMLAAANVPLSQDGSAGTSHSSRILTGVHLLQKKNSLCDVTLIAEGCKFSAHKAILAASSPYFWNLFIEKDPNASTDYNRTPGMSMNALNDNSNEVTISNVSSRALLGVLSFIYSSSVTNMKMTVSTIAEILLAAVKMQVMGLPQYCIDHLRVNIDFENCINVFVCGQKNNLESVIDTAIQFMTESFGSVTQTQSFLDMSIDELKALLKNDQLKENLGGNLEIAVQRWVKHDTLGRDLHEDGLMRLVPSTPRTPLKDVTRNRRNGGKTVENVNKTICLPKYGKGAILTPKIIAMGGEDIQGVLSERSYVYDPKTGQWEIYTTMPIRRLDLCTVNLDNHMYVVGGQHSADSKGTDSIGTIHRYNPRFDTWEQLHPMLKRRALFSLDAVNDNLYAVGGKNTQGSLASVECFNPDKNAWDYVSHLPLPVFGHASAVHDGKLYISGGVVSGRAFSCALQCYDPIVDKWSYYPPMGTKRAFHVMSQVGGKLYVIGGNTYNENGKRVDCRKVESYDLETNQWQTLTPMLQPVCFAAMATYKQYIYVIGGYNGRRSERHADVQRYNTSEDEWSVASQLPEPLIRLSACTLNLPASVTGPVMTVTRLNTARSEGSEGSS